MYLINPLPKSVQWCHWDVNKSAVETHIEDQNPSRFSIFPNTHTHTHTHLEILHLSSLSVSLSYSKMSLTSGTAHDVLHLVVMNCDFSDMLKHLFFGVWWWCSVGRGEDENVKWLYIEASSECQISQICNRDGEQSSSVVHFTAWLLWQFQSLLMGFWAFQHSDIFSSTRIPVLKF